MATSNADPLSGTGLAYEETKPQETPQAIQQPTQDQSPSVATQVSGSANPLQGTGLDYEKPLSASYHQVMKQDASKNAQIQKLATDTGMTPGQVAQNPEAIQTASKAMPAEQVDNLHNTHPALAKFVSQPENLASLWDDMPANGYHESVFQDFKKKTLESAASFIHDVAMPLAQGRIGPMNPSPSAWDTSSQEMAYQLLQNKADRILDADFQDPNILKTLPNKIAGVIPGLAETIGLWSNPLVGAETTFSGTYEPAYRESAQAGLPEDISKFSATGKAMVATGTTFLTMGLVGKLYRGLVPKVGVTAAKMTIGKAVALKLATDASFISQNEAQSFSNAWIDEQTGEDPNAIQKYSADLRQRLGMSILQSQVATIPGLGMHMISALPEGGQEKQPAFLTADDVIKKHIQNHYEIQSKTDKKMFLKAVESNKATKISTDNPHQAKARDAMMGDQYGAKTIHIPVEQFMELYQDDAPKIAEQLGPDFKDSFEKAQKTGGTVSGPFSEVLNTKADIKPNELADHVKFDDPTNKTVFEAQESKADLETQLKASEDEHTKQVADFEKMLKEGLEKLPNKAASGAGTQAKAIASVYDKGARLLHMSLKQFLGQSKFGIFREVKEGESEKAMADRAAENGLLTIKDDIKSAKKSLYIPPDLAEKLGFGDKKTQMDFKLGKAKRSVLDDIKGAGLPISFEKSSTSWEARQLATHWQHLKETGHMTADLPAEWEHGADASPEELLDILTKDLNQQSGVDILKQQDQKLKQKDEEYEAWKKANPAEAMKYEAEHFQQALTPEDEKDIFGNVLYHGGKLDRPGGRGGVTFLTSKKSVAEGYGNYPGAKVYEFENDFKKTFDISHLGTKKIKLEEFIKELVKNGINIDEEDLNQMKHFTKDETWHPWSYFSSFYKELKPYLKQAGFDSVKQIEGEGKDEYPAYASIEPSKLKIKNESVVDKVFNDKTLKPNLNAKQQDMFGPKEVKNEGPQQELFQAGFGSIYGIKAAGKADNGIVYVGENHGEVSSRGAKEGQSFGRKGQFGFMEPDGTFITRAEAKAKYGFETSEQLHKMQGGYEDWYLFQGHKGRTVISGPLGDPGGRDFKTYLTWKADQSTMFHEQAHNFVQLFVDHLAQGDAPLEAREQGKKMLDWFGIKDWSEFNERHSEMFARGFEYRLWEGKSPSGMEKVFAKFAEWMRRIWPSSQAMNQYLLNVGGKMTDEMRGVYDRFIATSEEIEQAEKDMGYKTEAPEGLSEQELDEWRSKQGAATQKSFNALTAQKMRMLKQDAHDQRANEKIKAEKKATEEVEALPIFQAEKFWDGPEGMTQYLGRSKEIAEKYLKGEADEAEKDYLIHVAINTGYDDPMALAHGLANCDKYKEIADRVNERMAQFTARVHGTPEEILTAALGGDERQDAIALEGALVKLTDNGQPQAPEKEPSKEPEALGPKIDEAGKTIAELKGNMLKGEMEKAEGKKAVTSITNAKPEPMTKQEANQKRREALEMARDDRAKAKVQALDIMAEAKLKDARDTKGYISDMEKASKKAQQFKDKGNKEKYTEWHDRRLLNHELALQSVKNKEFVTKTVKRMKDMAKIEKKPLHMPFGHWFQMKDILEQTGLKDAKPIEEEMFKTVAKNMAGKGHEPEEIADRTGMVQDGKSFRRETLQEFKARIGDRPKIEDRDESLAARINVPKTMDMKNMTMDDLRTIRNSMEAIYLDGRDVDSVMVDGKNESLKAKVGKFVETITANIGTPHARDILNREDKSGIPLKQRIIDSFLTLGDDFLPEINHVETVAELIDGAHVDETGHVVGGKEGPAHDLLTNRLRDAKSDERVLMRRIVEEHKGLYEKHYPTKKEQDALEKEEQVETSKGKETFTRTEARNLVAIAGSKEGRDRLMSGNKWTGEDFIKIADILEKQDVDYLRERAKLDEEHWPKVKELELKRGIDVKSCEKLPIETPHGTLPGMYHPISYDYAKGLTGLVSHIMGDKSELMDKAKFVPLGYPESGFTKARAGHVARPVRLDDGVYKAYLADTAHYLTHQEAIMDVNKALKNEDLQKALVNAFGAKGASLFAVQTKYIAYGAPGTRGLIDSAFQWSRITNILYHIGIRPKLFVVKRMNDIINLSDEIGGFKNYLHMQDDMTDKTMTMFSPKFRALMNDVDSKSSQMRDRGENFDYNVRAIHEAFAGKKGPLEWYRNNAYLPEKLADRRVAYLSWKYIETKALAEGKSQQVATRQADMFVEQVLGGASELQHIGIMRGEKYGEFGRSISPAFTFFSAQYQRMWLRGKLAAINYKANNPVLASKVIAYSLMRFIVTPTLITAGAIELIKHHKPEPASDRKKRVVDEGLAQTMGLFPMGRNIADQYIYHRPGDSVSLFPAEGIFQDVMDGMHSLFKLPSREKFTEKDARTMIDAATEIARAPQFMENEIFNLYDDVMKNGPKDWVNYLSATRYKLSNEKKPWANP